jgi:hypothetical protein
MNHGIDCSAQHVERTDRESVRHAPTHGPQPEKGANHFWLSHEVRAPKKGPRLKDPTARRIEAASISQGVHAVLSPPWILVLDTQSCTPLPPFSSSRTWRHRMRLRHLMSHLLQTRLLLRPSR